MFTFGARTIVIWMLIVVGAVLLMGSARAAAAAATSTGMRCLIFKQQWQPSEGVRPNAMQKSRYQTLERHSGACDAGNSGCLGLGLSGSPDNRYNLLRFRSHPGNSG